MFICLDCGRLVDDNEVATWTEPHGEQMEGCPYCYGALEEAHQCHICGEYFHEEDLMSDICEDCAKKDFEYETALKYLVETSRLREFFLVWYWQVASDVTDDENAEFDNTLISIFNAKVQEDKLTFTTAFYSRLKEYIFDDMYDWTEFLEKEVKANENGKG